MRNARLDRCTSLFYDQPWMILPEKMAALSAVLERRLAMRPADWKQPAKRPSAFASAKVRNVAGLPVAQVGRVAILPLHGVITQRPSLFSEYSGGTSSERFVSAHSLLLKDDSVEKVIWDVDSPGGSVSGTPEAAAELLALRGKKPTYAVSNTLMASAAYWLAAAADQIIASPSSQTGSIGVILAYRDVRRANKNAGVRVRYIYAGKYKAEGAPGTKLDDEALAALQQTVDDYYNQFVTGVSKARRVNEKRVRDGYGEGRALTADRSVVAGLADRVGTLGQVLNEILAGNNRSARVSLNEARQRLASASGNHRSGSRSLNEARQRLALLG